MQVLTLSLLSSQGVVHSLGVVACYSDYSSIDSYDCSDYSDCLSIPSLDSDSDSGICSCHTPIPGLTRLADPNRIRGARPYTGTLYLLFQTLV